MCTALHSLPSSAGLSSMFESLPSKEALLHVYHNGEARAEFVGTTLKTTGADRYFSETQLSALTGLVKEGDSTELIKEVLLYCPTLCEKYDSYAPIVVGAKEAVSARIDQARNPDRRPELIAEGKLVIKDVAAPYLSKIADKKAALLANKTLADKRLTCALQALQAAREHPAETAAALKATALDLLQYDKVAEYRDYIQTDAFASDTLALASRTHQLVTEALPSLAHNAAKQSIESLRARAAALSTEARSLLDRESTCAIERALLLNAKARSLLSELALHVAHHPQAGRSREPLESLAEFIAPDSPAEHMETSSVVDAEPSTADTSVVSEAAPAVAKIEADAVDTQINFMAAAMMAATAATAVAVATAAVATAATSSQEPHFTA